MASNPLTCLLKKLKEGKVDKASVKRITELTNKYTDQLKGVLGEDEAVLQASKEALVAFEHDLNNQIIKSNALFNAFDSADKALEGKGLREANQIVKQLTLDNHQFAIEGNHRVYAGPIAEAMEKLGESFYKNLSPSDNLTLVDGLIKGTRTKNAPLQSIIDAARKSFDFQDADLMRLGASGHRKAPKNTLDMTFYMGHLQNIEKEEFLSDIMSNVDTDHLLINSPYIDKMKGGLKDLIDLGYDVLKDGAGAHRTRIEKLGVTPAEFKMSFIRNLRVSEPENWMNMQGKYGDGAAGEVDVLSHMLNRSENAARQAAKLQYFGANPEALVKHIEGNLQSKGFRADKIEQIVKGATDNAKYVSGGYENHLNPFYKTTFNNPITQKPFMPIQALSTFKSMGGFLLGFRASIAAFMTDPAYIKAFQKNLGFKARGRLRTMNATDASMVEIFENNREITARLKLTIDGTLDKMHARVRGMDSTFGSRAVNKGVTRFLKMSGMTPATAMNRQTNVMNSAFNLGELKGTAFNKLNPELAQSFDRFAITEADWNVLRKEGVRTLEGVDQISPDNILDKNPEVGKKIAQWFSWAQENGTPTSSIRQQKFIAKMRDTGPLQAGLTEMMVTFMGFSGSVWQNHVTKALGGTSKGFSYYAGLNAYTTFAGALTLVAANTLTNKKSDPTSFDFWADAWNVGGAGSYFTDLIANDGRSLDKTLGSKITSFTGGTILQASEVIKKNAEKALKGEETKLAADLFRLSYKFLPGQSLWYLKELMEESFKKPVLRILDPKGQKRRDKRAKKEELL